MSDLKISEYAAGGVAQSTDQVVVARAGNNYTLLISDLAAAGRPLVIQAPLVTVTSSQTATLFSAPVTLIPGVVNKVNIPIEVHIYKAAGTSWASSGSGLLGVNWTGHAAYSFALFDQTTTTAFFGAAANTWIAQSGSGSANAANKGPCGLVTTTVNPVTGVDVILSLTAANISGGTGSMSVNIWYRQWSLTTP